MVFSVHDERLGERLQLPVSTGRLLELTVGPQNGEYVLVVLLQQVHRVLRHGEITNNDKIAIDIPQSSKKERM